MDEVHKSALLEEVIKYLNPKPGDQIIDATLDGGGHSMSIVEQIAPDGKVLGVEWDNELLKEFKTKIQKSKFKNNIILVNDNYVNIAKIIHEYNFRPNGILFDLGLSSWHYEKSGRGFSFKKDEPLDMRYNPNDNQKIKNLTAAEIVNTYSEEELERVFKEYGEEQFSKQIARNTIFARKRKLILRTVDLVEVVSQSIPEWYRSAGWRKKIHFATKTFQALRIEVNSELENIERGISSAIDVLESGGRLVVISFHGLEDKIVREIFKNKTKERVVKFVIKGTIRPSWKERKSNPRSRSAKMKIVEKI